MLQLLVYDYAVCHVVLRYGRGLLARQLAQRLRENRAATKIQAVVKGFIQVCIRYSSTHSSPIAGFALHDAILIVVSHFNCK